MQFNELIGFKSGCGIHAVLENIRYYPFHLHTGILEIICIINGKVKICDSAHDHTLSYGDVYFFNNSDPHKIEAITPDSIILTVHIDLGHYKQFFTEFEGSSYDLVSQPYFICDSFRYEDKYSTDIKYLRFLIAKIYTEYIKEDFSDHSLEQTCIRLLKHSLINYLNYSYSKIEGNRYIIIKRDILGGSNLEYKRLYKIIDYIYDHFREKITLKYIASNEFLNPSYLSTYIKRTCGLTFSEILAISRCEEAARLLSDTDKTVDQIASEVGFANRSNLNKQFKKLFFKTPARYRKNIQSDLLRSNSIHYETFDYSFAKKIINAYLDGY